MTHARTAWLRKGALSALGCLMALSATGFSTDAAAEDNWVFQRIPVQYIAALGAPDAKSGTGAEHWGLWLKDPGPRGVLLTNYDRLEANGGVAPARWAFDGGDWWLEENGVIMEAPEFSLPAGKYVVTGNREVVSVLTVHPPDENGEKRWELDSDATLYDVTHLRCRSARYTPAAGEGSCLPSNAQISWFPVTPGGPMPAVDGCNKQDYTVLFVIGVGVKR